MNVTPNAFQGPSFGVRGAIGPKPRLGARSCQSGFAPFGGHKQSGFGAEYGIEGLKEFTYSQVITIKKDALV